MKKAEPVVFARIGWMKKYAGSIPGDESPIGGGKNNIHREAQNELFNFYPVDGCLYGFVDNRGNMNLSRIKRQTPRKDIKLDGVLVIFFATNPSRKGTAVERQTIVGWYKNATVLRSRKRDPTKGKREGKFYNLTARAIDAWLVPEPKRKHPIPRAKNGIPGVGQSNVRYVLDEQSGRPLKHDWIRDAIRYVDEYTGPNVLNDPRVETVSAVEAADEESQGYQSDAKIREAVETQAMKKAEHFYRKLGYDVRDVSKTYPWDLECTKQRKTLKVEVKGLQDVEGNRIILTGNEVEEASQPGANMELFVVFDIKVQGEGKPRANGGTCHRYEGWNPRNHNLRPTYYQCELAKDLGSPANTVEQTRGTP